MECSMFSSTSLLRCPGRWSIDDEVWTSFVQQKMEKPEMYLSGYTAVVDYLVRSNTSFFSKASSSIPRRHMSRQTGLETHAPLSSPCLAPSVHHRDIQKGV